MRYDVVNLQFSSLGSGFWLIFNLIRSAIGSGTVCIVYACSSEISDFASSESVFWIFYICEQFSIRSLLNGPS